VVSRQNTLDLNQTRPDDPCTCAGCAPNSFPKIASGGKQGRAYCFQSRGGPTGWRTDILLFTDSCEIQLCGAAAGLLVQESAVRLHANWACTHSDIAAVVARCNSPTSVRWQERAAASTTAANPSCRSNIGCTIKSGSVHDPACSRVGFRRASDWMQSSALST
jgi:hypothetical protein